jgi:hypothetical protein
MVKVLFPFLSKHWKREVNGLFEFWICG